MLRVQLLSNISPIVEPPVDLVFAARAVQPTVAANVACAPVVVCL
jgi:hypothetical protein